MQQLKKVFYLFLAIIPFGSFAQQAQLVIKSGLQSKVVMAAISFDNTLGLTVEDNEVLILWELKTGRQLQSFKNIMAADFSEKSNTLEVVTNDYTFKTIDFSGKVVSESAIKSSGNDRHNRLNLSFYRKSKTLLENGRIYTRNKGLEGRIMVEKYGTEQDFSEAAHLISIPFKNEVSVCEVPGGKLIKTFKTSLYNRPNTTDDIKFTRFSPDGKLLMVGNNYSLEILNLATGERIYSFDYHDNNNAKKLLNVANFSPDGTQLIILCTDFATQINIAEKKAIWGKPQTEFGFNQYSSYRGTVKFSDDGKTVLLGCFQNLHFLDAASGNVISKIKGITNSQFTFNHWKEKEQKLIVEENGEVLKALNWNLGMGSLEKITDGEPTMFGNNFSVSSDGVKLYQYFVEINQKNSTKKGFLFPPTRDLSYTKQELSGNDKYLAVTMFQKNLQFSDPGYFKVVVSETAGKKKLWEKQGVEHAGFDNKGSSIAVVISTNNRHIIQVLNAATGGLIKNYPIAGDHYINSIAFSPKDNYLHVNTAKVQLLINVKDGSVHEIPKILPNANMWYGGEITPDEKWLIVSDQFGLLQFYDIPAKEWNKRRTIKAYSNAVLAISFSGDGRFMFVNERESNVKLFSLERDELIATLYPVSGSGDWAVLTPDGRFDASADAQKDIYFVRNMQSFPLETIFETYYTPRLLPRLLNGEKFIKIDTDPNGLLKAPIVNIGYATTARNLDVSDDVPLFENNTGVAEINVTATAPEGIVDEIRLFHNGKIVTLTTRNLIVSDDDKNNSTSKKYLINLLPGMNNFRALALNGQRTESKPAELDVLYKTATNTSTVQKSVSSKEPVLQVRKDATLHLIVVGINEYQNKTMSLNYAMADATSFKEELEKDSKTILANIKTYFVTNNTADKTGITNAFKQVQQNAKAQDVFIFYYAGHGVIGKDKEFYLVPTDVSDLKNVQTELELKGIPSKLLQQYAIDIQAQKQLFILDACQSAGAFEKLLSNDGDQQKSLAVVARSTGTHWMAASGAMQYANEFSSLGHGVFTYVLLQALKGEAANNKMITVNGLKSFLQVQVPLLMKKYNGAAQYPASYGVGNDFPVELLK